MKSVVFSLLALSAPKVFARVPFSKPAILNIRGGVVGGDIITEVKEDFKGISIDPNMALGLSTAATVKKYKPTFYFLMLFNLIM